MTVMNPIESALDYRSAVTAIEAILKEFPQATIETLHHYANGIYAREVRMPKGTIAIGKIHKTEHFCVLNGDIDVCDENGKTRFTGHALFKTPAGIKRAVFAHQDTVFTTFHAIPEASIEELERQLVSDSYADYLLTQNLKNGKIIP